ncbi:MAG: hypothetical protein K0S81_1227 [Rhodospirillales bacterium]|nr:hypothetical protein [Rhodospirillales bacterium]
MRIAAESMPVQELFAVLVVSILLAPAMAAAGEYQDVPCEQLHFRIEGEYVLARCHKQTEQKGGDWQATSEVIVAEDLSGLTLVQRSVAHRRSAMYKDKALESIEQLGVKNPQDWSGAARLSGYTIHRFRISTDRIPNASCFYFERYEQPRGGGYGLALFGFSCVNGVDPIDDATAAAMLDRIVLQ